MMKQEYIETFRDHLREGDQLFLLPIFYAGGSAARDISSNDLADKIAGDGKRAGVMENRNMLFERLGEWQTYVVFGARDDTLAVFAEQIAEKLKQ
jgi:UDP-N-acetylmuramate--alanine ligase